MNSKVVLAAVVRKKSGEFGLKDDLETSFSQNSMDVTSEVHDGNALSQEITYELCGSLSVEVPLSGTREDSLYSKSWLILDSGATVHLIRDLCLFEGVPIRIPDHEVSVVGFDTTHGNAIALAKGILKWPLAGVEAYFSRNCIGNIISELKIRDTHNIYRKEFPNKWADTNTVSRIVAGDADDLHFLRGIEGILICDVDRKIKDRGKVHDYTFPALVEVRRPLLGSAGTAIVTRLIQLGLKYREAQASVLLDMLSCGSRDLLINLRLMDLGLNAGQREGLACKGELISISALESNARKDPYLNLCKLHDILQSLRSLRAENVHSLSYSSGLSDVGCRTLASHTQSKSRVSNVSSNLQSGVSHEPDNDVKEVSKTDRTAVQSELMFCPEVDSKWTITNCCYTANSARKCGSVIRRYGDSLSSSESVLLAKIPTSLAGLGERETWAVFQLGCLNLSIGELMVAGFAVTARLTVESQFVGLTLRQRGLSKEVIKRIARVERLHRLTSYVSLAKLAAMVKHNLVEGIDGYISVADVERYRDLVHEMNCVCALGKIRKPSPMKNYNFETTIRHVCYCDVFQLTSADKSIKYMFMLGVDGESQAIFVQRIANSSVQELRRAITCFVDLYDKHLKKLNRVYLDNAGGLLNNEVKEFLKHKHIVPCYCTSELHVRVAEAAVKVVKSLCRTTVLDWSTARRFITAFVPYLVVWVVQTINFSLRSGSDHASPHLRFTGDPIKLNVHLRFAFLDVVVVHKIVTNSIDNLESKGKIGLVVGRNGDTGALTVLDLETMRECKRYHLKLLEGPEVTKYVNTKLSGAVFEAEGFATEGTDDAQHTMDKFELTEPEMDKVRADLRLWVENSMLVPKVATAEKPQVKPKSNQAVKAVSEVSEGAKGANLGGGGGPIVNNEVLGVMSNNNQHFMRSRSKSLHLKELVEVLSKKQAFSSEVPEDGSCMFYSIASYFHVERDDYAWYLRHKVCDYIRDHRSLEIEGITLQSLIEALSPEDSVDTYCSKMRLKKTYADEIELVILARLLEIVIIIFAQVNNTYVFKKVVSGLSKDQEKPKVVYLNHVGDEHYEPLHVIDEAVRKEHLQRLVCSDPNLMSVQSQSAEEGIKSDFKFNLHTLELSMREAGKSRNKRKSAKSKDGKSAELDMESGRFLDEFEEESYHVNFTDIIALTTLGSETKVPINGRPSSKENSLRTRRGSEVVDKAGRDEIAQMRKKEVMKFQTQAEVFDLRIKGHIPVPVIMLNKEKFGSDGVFEKIKARLIALGNLQEEMAKYLKEAPTASLQSFYLMILIAAKKHIRLQSIDVSGAFLNAKLEETEEVYVTFPVKLAQLAVQDDPSLKSYLLSNGSLVARLQRCLYGLQQSPQRWFKTIQAVLVKLEFKASIHDPCFFIKQEGNELNLLLLYVDDMLLAFQNPKLADQLKCALIEEFEGVTTQDESTISFLGFTIRQSEAEITLDQQGYIKKMIEALHLESIPVYKNPLGTLYKITDDRFLKNRKDADPKNLALMRSLSMTLMYLALRTRKDVLFLASFFASIPCPELQDLAAIKRVMVYIYNTIYKRQHFYREGVINALLMGDSSHNLFSDARGQMCTLIYADAHSAAVDMSCNKLPTTTLSVFESELVVQVSLCEKGKLFWTRLQEVGIIIHKPMRMLGDNLSAINSAKQERLLVSARSKYMNPKLFWLFDEVQGGWVTPEWITTLEMDADIGTKPLTGHQFHYLSERQFSRKPGFVHDCLDLSSVIVYADADEPYEDFTLPNEEEDEMSV